jgi:tetratricopeptide (TPR) repeat protein
LPDGPPSILREADTGQAKGQKLVSAILIVVLVGLFYIVVMGGMALLRHEGLSIQFALEALAFIALVVLLRMATGLTVDAILLFLLLYLITMRARLLTDLGNLIFRRRGYGAAEPFYRLALRLRPDPTGRYVVLINWGVARLLSGDLDGAIDTLNRVLTLSDQLGGLGTKYEAACRYNLGVAHRKAGDDVRAVLQFNQVAEMFPASVYAQAAEKALKKRRGAQ